MGAFAALMAGRISPVGEPIRVMGNNLLAVNNNSDCIFLDSGTSALALAIILAKQKFTTTKTPQVIVPAYGCPDLIAAVAFAECTAVLVDIQKHSTDYDIQKLETALNKHTVAIIAPHFCSFIACTSKISSLLDSQALAPRPSVIEDSAQRHTSLTGKMNGSDFMVFSYGRGKPVSILGGGALIFPHDYSDLANRLTGQSIGAPNWIMQLKFIVYNITIMPFFFYFISKLPFLKLGQTRLKRLFEIRALKESYLKFIANNIAAHATKSISPELEYKAFFSSRGDQFSEIEMRIGDREKMLRFPVLCQTKELRDDILARGAGLGLSAMYQSSLHNIEGVDEHSEVHSEDNAKQFSERLITLPTHTHVSPERIQRILSIFLSTNEKLLKP